MRDHKAVERDNNHKTVERYERSQGRRDMRDHKAVERDERSQGVRERERYDQSQWSRERGEITKQ